MREGNSTSHANIQIKGGTIISTRKNGYGIKAINTMITLSGGLIKNTTKTGAVAVYNIHYNNKIKMYESIDLLDLKYRNVVILKCYFDLSYDEIGYILDLNSDTVKIYFRQSLKNLKVNVGEGL